MIAWVWKYRAWVGVVGVMIAGIIVTEIVIQRAYVRGWNAAVAKIEKANVGAEKGARDAVENLRRECARDPADCLRDRWTRDD